MSDFEPQSGVVETPASPMEQPTTPSSPDQSATPVEQPQSPTTDIFQDPRIREWQSKKDREIAAANRRAVEVQQELERVRHLTEQNQRQQTQAQFQSEYQQRMSQARTDVEKQKVYAEFQARAAQMQVEEAQRELQTYREQQAYQQDVAAANAWFDFAADTSVGVPVNVLQDINRWTWGQTQDPIQAQGLAAAAIMQWQASEIQRLRGGTPTPQPTPPPTNGQPRPTPVVAPTAAAGAVTEQDLWRKATSSGNGTDWSELKRALNIND